MIVVMIVIRVFLNSVWMDLVNIVIGMVNDLL